MLSFVDRKEALENQIEIEKQLLETARESRDNLDFAVQKANADLEKLIEQDASRALLQKARGTLETVEQLKGETQAEIDTRRDYLDTLRERLDNLHEEQLAGIRRRRNQTPAGRVCSQEDRLAREPSPPEEPLALARHSWSPDVVGRGGRLGPAGTGSILRSRAGQNDFRRR